MDQYKAEDMPLPHIGDWCRRYADVKKPPPPSTWHGDLGTDQAQDSRRGYYGSVSFIDEQIGRILAIVKKRKMLDNTLILFLADHGDMLGDHHLWRKTYAYKGSAGIPMLLRWPESMGMKDKRGKSIDTVVELRDVLPTFLDTAKAPIPKHLDGVSMLSFIRNPTAGKGRIIDLEHSMCYNRDHWNAITDGKHKYIYYAYDGREELFDLEKDLGELKNLATRPEYKNLLGQWRKQLVDVLSERGERFVKDGKLTLRKKRLLYSPLFPKKEREFG
jgi:arylsulfatase A-like enzyme